MFNFFPAVVFGGAKLCWAELNISKMWLTTDWCSVGQANICNSLWKILAFGWIKLDVAISGRGKGNSVATSSIKSQSLSNLRLSLINAFNVFNQATGKKAKAGEWLKGSPSGGGGKSVSQRDSSNSVKHFTYLHINWLKRKYTPDTRTQSQSFECVNMAKWQKGRKGPGLLLAAFALSPSHSHVWPSPSLNWGFSSLAISDTSNAYDCFPFDQRIVKWFTDWVQAQMMRWQHQCTHSPVEVPPSFRRPFHTPTLSDGQSVNWGNVWKRWKTFRSYPLTTRLPSFLLKSFLKSVDRGKVVTLSKSLSKIDFC